MLPKGKRVGKVLYDGHEIEQLEDLRSVKEVGYLFQNPSAQMVMDTVWHEIAFGLENLGMPYEQMKRTVARSLIILICRKYTMKIQTSYLADKNNW